MIVEWFLDLVIGFVNWFLELFEPLSVPSWLAAPSGDMAAFVSNVSSMGVWVPWGLLASVVASVIGVYVVTFTVKLIKQILAHVPAVGGAG